VPKLWKSNEEGEAPAETPRSARGARNVAAVATPVRNPSSGSQSARCSPAPSSSSKASRPAASAKEADDSDSVEVDAITRKMLAAVYEQPLAEEQAAVVLGICPEVTWLVQCTLRSPLPPGWRKRSNGSYINSETGEKSASSPILDSFAKLARLSLHARQTPASAATAAAWVRRARDDALKSALRTQDEWTGPHLDESVGAEYYHSASSGVSTWTSPFAPDMYLAHVADRLLQSEAFPARSSEDPTLEDVAAEIQTARQAQKSARKPSASTRPVSATAKTSSNRREPAVEVKPGNDAQAQTDAAAALASAAAAVAMAAAALTGGQGAAPGSQDGAGALANAAAALTAAAQLSARGEHRGLRGKKAEEHVEGASTRCPSTSTAEPLPRKEKAETSEKPQELDTKAEPPAGEATPSTTASIGSASKEPVCIELNADESSESSESEESDGSSSPTKAEPAGEEQTVEPEVCHQASAVPQLELQAEPEAKARPARGSKKPHSPLSSEAALKLAFELTAEDEPEMKEKPAAEISSLLGGNGARPAVPKLMLAKPLPGPPPRPAAAPSPEDASSSSSATAAPVPPPPAAAARTAAKDSKIKAAPAPPTSAADLFSKGNRTSFVGGA